jgi:Xaa-Pro aminopeptidase
MAKYQVRDICWPMGATYEASKRPSAVDESLRDFSFRLMKDNQAMRKIPLKKMSNANALFEKLRSVKDAYEIEQCIQGVSITEAAFKTVALSFAQTTPISEARLRGIVCDIMFTLGAELAFPPIIAAGIHGLQGHYDKYDKTPIESEQTVIIDMGARVNWFASDMTMTLPRSGRYSPAQKALAQACYSAMLAGVKTAKAGNTYVDSLQALRLALTKELVKLGLLEGDPDTLFEQKAYIPLYPHSGHYLGYNCHDIGRYRQGGDLFEEPKMKAGQIIAVEPGIYVPEDWNIGDPAYRGLASRMERTVLVGEGEGKILGTKDFPCSPDEVEQWMASVHTEILSKQCLALKSRPELAEAENSLLQGAKTFVRGAHREGLSQTMGRSGLDESKPRKPTRTTVV